MTGSGNDFVMVDGRHTSPADWSDEDIQAVCARGTGVGADGLVFLRPGSALNTVAMIYFNSDGSRAAMCGNAALCSTRLAARLGIASGEGMKLETDAGVYSSRCAGAGERAELGLGPVDAPAAVPGLALDDGERRAALGTVGVPHLVVLVDDVSCVDVDGRGRMLRSDATLGPEGANVNFVSAGGSSAEWLMRTYERGVEAETLACGTGAVAAACAVVEWGLAKPPVTIWTRSGRPLEIRATRLTDGSYDDIWLAGEARLVLRGVIN
ncbi:MAG: diaminopimelate epimerase [Gemmatimonadetes bacterium 13_1_40CM_3_69_22]|nr:MAG: diaminopimelate epimerase [Gemmatimonadetes bacterium 13_2_20CM_69_8]OLD05907.1 MAG: diaminopimelate epimerase [Gemmatimonadetes bacterium 13_1_40CM_3_69_22]OLD94178.1 MAG: diaminopimelate epimerase [Gemmatimonadetes bacterium 13_1_20CM_4_69_16]PYO15062.1 MAG: diaminopimelate epimerase [Gemmatimonadota bacterium]